MSIQENIYLCGLSPFRTEEEQREWSTPRGFAARHPALSKLAILAFSLLVAWLVISPLLPFFP